MITLPLLTETVATANGESSLKREENVPAAFGCRSRGNTRNEGKLTKSSQRTHKAHKGGHEPAASGTCASTVQGQGERGNRDGKKEGRKEREGELEGGKKTGKKGCITVLKTRELCVIQ